MGIAQWMATKSQRNPIVPLIAMVIALMGVVASIITPKEEDPQINVTMVDIFLSAPTLSARDMEMQVVSHAEHQLAQMHGVDHIYSVSSPGHAVVTIQYKVGIERQEALVQTWNQVLAELHWSPELGVLPPLVRAKGINDVPIINFTLSSSDKSRTAAELADIGNSLAQLLKRVPGTRNISVTGSNGWAMKVDIDPVKVAAFGLDFRSISAAIAGLGKRSYDATITSDNHDIIITPGRFIRTANDLSSIIVKTESNKVVTLADVATVSRVPHPPTEYVQMGYGLAHGEISPLRTAVVISVAKKAGQNAIDIANATEDVVEQFSSRLLPPDMKFDINKNSGETASGKANKLIEKLFFATGAVVVLVLIFLGGRPALIVGASVGLTLLATLVASYAWGFTLNRISLFALIFSIGILVDDAIVVVENIHRRRVLEPNRSLSALIPEAVQEVGGSTILATFTVIAALVPMAFVSGLMGPYMSPIPVNASTGMLISLLIAFTFTPWVAEKVFSSEQSTPHSVEHKEERDRLGELFRSVLRYFVDRNEKKRQWTLFIGLSLALGLAILLPVTGLVTLKMLPFDNKPNMAISIDLPEGTSLESTLAATQAIAWTIQENEYVKAVELYAGTNAPITFNGLVRQYYLRQQPHLAAISILLVDKHHRSVGSHDIAKAVRTSILPVAKQYDANVKVVEEPSGPPTFAPIVAQIYGASAEGRAKKAQEVKSIFHSIPDMVDIDTTLADVTTRESWVVDTALAAHYSVSPAEVISEINKRLNGQTVGFVEESKRISSTPVLLSYNHTATSDLNQVLAAPIVNQFGYSVPMSDLIKRTITINEQPIYHKDLRAVTYVVGDLAGEVDSPLYGMFDAIGKLEQLDPALKHYYTKAPKHFFIDSIKWDGEWQITYETFRDMGVAYSAGLLLIFVLIVAKFKRYRVPLIIMAPIPLTLIGIFPGHALLNAKFTAPSMIGMIALAGIIVRNSILLVDVIDHQLSNGKPLKEAIVDSAFMRARPILLTAFAAMLGATFILDDPIFKGLAISLIFGVLIASLLTLIAIPIGYYRLLIKIQRVE